MVRFYGTRDTGGFKVFLYTLDTQYLLYDMIEGYESLIWTERYSTWGDFELQTYLVNETLAVMPLGTLLSLQDTPAIMFVETHEVSTDENGSVKLRVTGRSLDAFMENRAAIQNDTALGTTGTPPLYSITGPSHACAATLIRNSMVTGTVDVKDIIPNFDVSDVVIISTPSSYHEIERGTLYDAVRKMLAEDNLGLEVRRPMGVVTQLRFNIFIGVDRTDVCYLYESNGDFTTSSYVSSIKDYTTVVYCAGPTQISNPVRTGTTTYTGFKRRAAMIDASDITTTVASDQIAALTAKGKSYLSEHNSIKVFDCVVSPGADATYRYNYYLGDIITCISFYGINQAMTVVEYVRVEDQNGEVGFPGLAVIS